MNKSTRTTVISVILLALAGIGIFTLNTPAKSPTIDGTSGTTGGTLINTNGPTDAKNATYLIDGKKVTLIYGVATTDPAPGSTSKTITRYFGNEVIHDLNGDGRDDIAFLLTQETGGSGVFYYLVAALNTPNGYIGSQGFLLGDRIAPQTTFMGKGNIIVVNFADRKPTDPFTAAPSIGRSMWLLLDPKTMQFGEVDQNYTGDADPATMKLDMQKWAWINTVYNNGSTEYGNGSTTMPRDPSTKRFTLSFKPTPRSSVKGTFAATTDCNSVGGDYTVSDSGGSAVNGTGANNGGGGLVFSNIMSTLMYCPNSQEAEFAAALARVQSYRFTTKGELILGLKYDGGSMTFK